MEFTDIEITDEQCIVCQKPRPKEGDINGGFYPIQGHKLYICNAHLSAFSIGVGIGHTELNAKVIHALGNIDDEATGWDVKQHVYDIIPLARRQVQEYRRMLRIPIKSPRDIYQELDISVVGQADAKRAISIAVFEHVRQLRDFDTSVAPDKHNILLLGPSGSGKTLLAHTVARTLELPFVSADATSFSPTGFQGADADSMITDLYQRSRGVVPTAERGVVFLDELDKLGTYYGGNSSRTEFFNMSTQNSLLRLIEGKRVKVPTGQQFGETVNVNTEKMLFFFGGAFPGLVDIIAKLKGYSGKKMGFRTDDSDKMEVAMRNYEMLVNADTDTMVQALIEYGMGAELVGRIPVIVPLAPLNKDELRQCLLELDHSPIPRQKWLFGESGFQIDFEEEVIDKIVDTAYKMATGTRALNSLVKRAVSQAAFDLLVGPTRKKQGRIVITPDCLFDPSQYRQEAKRASRQSQRAQNQA